MVERQGAQNKESRVNQLGKDPKGLALRLRGLQFLRRQQGAKGGFGAGAEPTRGRLPEDGPEVLGEGSQGEGAGALAGKGAGRGGLHLPLVAKALACGSVGCWGGSVLRDRQIHSS